MATTGIYDGSVTTSKLGVVDYNQLMQDEINRRLREASDEFAVSMSFSDVALETSGNKLAFMGTLYQATTDQLVALLRKEGYPDGSYKVQFLTWRNPDGMTSKLIAKAMIDKRLKLWTPAEAPAVKEAIAEAQREGMINPTLPLPPEKLDETLRIKRVRLIADASMG